MRHLLHFDDRSRVESQGSITPPAPELRAQPAERAVLTLVDPRLFQPIADGELEIVHAEARLERQDGARRAHRHHRHPRQPRQLGAIHDDERSPLGDTHELGNRAFGMVRPRAARFSLVQPHDRPREIRVDAFEAGDDFFRQRERDDLTGPPEFRRTTALSARTFHGGKSILEANLLRDQPAGARWYILSVIALGAVTFCALVPRATFTPIVPLVFLVLLSSLTSAFKVQFAVASGSNMSVSYVDDIAALILRGPHATMIVGAASGWSQTTLNSRTPNPAFRTLFNMAILVLTVEAAGQVYQRLGGRPDTDPSALILPLAGMALTYFFVNTVPIALAIALTTNQSA